MNLGLGLTIGQRGGSAAITPASVSGLITWLDPSDSSARTLNGSNQFTALVDKSGVAGDWSANTNVPSGTINGLLALDFQANVAQRMIGPDYSSLGITAAEGFIVGVCDAEGGTSRTMWWFGSGNGLFPANTANISESFFSTTAKGVLDPGTLTAPFVWNVVSTAAEFTTFFNGTQASTTATNTVVANSTTRLGVHPSNIQPWDGRMGEVVIYSRKLTAGEKAAVYGYLADKWGVT